MSNVEPVIHVLLQLWRAVHVCLGDALVDLEELFTHLLSKSFFQHRSVEEIGEENAPTCLRILCALRNWQGNAFGREIGAT